MSSLDPIMARPAEVVPRWRDPLPYLMCTPAAEQGEWSSASRWPCAPMRAADVAVSSDNMSPGRDTSGHAEYSAGGTFNTGILFIRGNAQGQGFAKAWAENVASPARGTRFAGDTSDQQVFNRMVRDETLPYPGLRVPRGAGRMVAVPRGNATLGALPLALFVHGEGCLRERAPFRRSATRPWRRPHTSTGAAAGPMVSNGGRGRPVVVEGLGCGPVRPGPTRYPAGHGYFVQHAHRKLGVPPTAVR